MTNSALGWATEPNVEILCSPGPEFDAASFEATLVEDSREVGDREFARWQFIQATVTQGDEREFSAHSWSHLNAWRPTTRDPANLLLAYRGLHGEIASPDELDAVKRDMDILRLPQGLTREDVENWIAMAFLSAPFVQSVLTLKESEITVSSRVLSENYDLSVTDARRGAETVHNWFGFFLSD